VCFDVLLLVEGYFFFIILFGGVVWAFMIIYLH